jgi:hypothetical protein
MLVVASLPSTFMLKFVTAGVIGATSGADLPSQSTADAPDCSAEQDHKLTSQVGSPPQPARLTAPAYS